MSLIKQGWCCYLCGPQEHALGDVVSGGGDDTERDAGEDVGVVALSRVEGLAVHRHVGERGARWEHTAPLNPQNNTIATISIIYGFQWNGQ